MSVTFFAPDAPTRKVTPYPESDPDYEIDESELPKLNLSNSNAGVLLDLLDIPLAPAYSGCIEVHEMDALIAKLLIIGNKDSARSRVLRDFTSSQDTRVEQVNGLTTIGKGPKVIDCGLSDTQVQRYTQTLLSLLTQAKQQGYRVFWG